MRRVLILLCVAIATSLCATGSAHAAGPVHEWLDIDDSFTFDGCGFAVEEHDAGRLHFISWFDAAGVRERQLVAAPGLSITYTNVATGASVSTANPFAVHKSDNPDGSATIAFTGLVFAIAGQGPAYVDAGRELIVFSPVAGVEVLSSVGPTDDLCEALAAAIG